MQVYILHEENPEVLDLYILHDPDHDTLRKLSQLAGLLINVDDVSEEQINWLYPEGRFRFRDLPKRDWKKSPVLRGTLFKVGMAM